MGGMKANRRKVYKMQMQNNNSYLSIIESPAMRIYPNVALCDRGMRQNFANERYRRYPQRNLWAGKKERVVSPIQKIHAATGCARTELPAKRTSATNVIARNSWKPTRFSGGRMSPLNLLKNPNSVSQDCAKACAVKDTAAHKQSSL